jgi:Mechanosensitive ion channel, conserved TM helix
VREIIQKLIQNVGLQVINFLPNILGALLWLLVGWLVAWLVKRIVIQLCVIFRLHRYLPRLRWRKALAKADVRHALFNYLGNLAFVAVFLFFLYSALSALKLTILSHLLEQTIFFVPRVIGCFIIFGAGFFLSTRISVAVHMAVLREGIPRASLIGRFVKGALLLFFSAMALTVLGFARQIVIIGFAVSFLTLGGLVVVVAAAGGKEMVQRIFRWPEEK